MNETTQPPKLVKHTFVLSIDENSIQYCVGNPNAMMHFQDLLSLHNFEKKDVIFDEEGRGTIWQREIELSNDVYEGA